MFTVTVSPVRARPPGVLRRASGALRAIAFAAALAAPGMLAISASAAAGALDQMHGFVTSVKSARGEFVQRQVKGEPGKDMRLGAQSSGSFVFARPGKFVWQYRKPYEQVLHADGEKLFIWDKDLDQVTVRKLGDALASSPAAVLFGSNDLEKLYTLKEGGSRDGIDWLELVPKQKDSQFSRIGVGFRGNAPEAMELRDAFGNTTLLTFSNLERNPALPAQQFRFVMPKGVDVIGD